MRALKLLAQSLAAIAVATSPVMLATLLLTVGCETKTEAHRRALELGLVTPKSGSEDPRSETPPKAGKFGTGVIQGRVIVEGAAPAPASLAATLAAKPECVKKRSAAGLGELMAESVAVGPDGGFKDCIVYIKSGLGRYGVADWSEYGHEAPLIDQVGCQYVPHVITCMVNQSVTVRSSDAFLHNVSIPSVGKNDPFNSAGEKVYDRLFKKTGKQEFVCAVHSWMSAKAYVLDHPFCAKTGADGKFQISKLPEGVYTVAVWHEKDLGIKLLSKKGHKITVGADGAVTDADGAPVTELVFKYKAN
jgi:hypothetical protein